ncbi:DUF4385 domain-containing protein [Nocardioides lentus]|uniref:DUF4385 domain-containing protein n=1 Tax=Nocardioides lentus TaxID=338077 RepID=A0ABP5A6F9_9ACTN
MREFDYSLDYDGLDLREHPELYSVGRGEQGVLRVQPYKSELLPLWRFATEDDARESSAAITERFHAYLEAGDFVGADMARKFLQMGHTRARRYANHRGGKKYDGPVPDDRKGVSGAHGRAEKPRLDEADQDPEKVAAAAVFKAAWRAAADDPTYRRMKVEHRRRHEDADPA